MSGGTRSSTWGLWLAFGGSKPVLALSIASGLLAGGSSASLVAIVNRTLSSGETAVGETTPVLFLGLCLLALFSTSLSVTLLARIGQENQYRLRMSLARRILSAPVRQLESCGAHRLTAALTDDVQSVVGAQEVLPNLFVEGAKIIGAFAYLIYLSPPLFCFVLAFVVLGLTTSRALQLRVMRGFALARETDDALFRHFRALTEGYKELKLDARRRSAFLDDELDPTARQLRNQLNRTNTLAILANNWGESLYYFCIGAILFVAPYFVMAPQATLTGFTLAILFLGAPLSVIFNGVHIVARGLVAFRNIEDLGLENSENAASEGERPFEGAPPTTLELVNVSYRHPAQGGEAGYPIGPVDLAIRPGELIFVTGGNGSGKTTLMLVILGLYTPTTGELRIGGEKVTDENREAYRQNFSAVFADSYVFDRLLGYDAHEQQQRAQALLGVLKLDEKLRIDDGRFSTVDLSRGERKRLALLAACLSDRAFFVFDEWAADQDPPFRDFFYRRMLPDLKARGKTVIVITHDDRYFDHCDRRFHLTVGQVEEIAPRARASLVGQETQSA